MSAFNHIDLAMLLDTAIALLTAFVLGGVI